jgi:Na+/proline symporter
MGLQTADYGVLIAYFVAIVLIGFWTAKKLKSSDEFFMPRKFGKFMMIMFGFGTGTHSDQAVSVAAKSYANGVG